MARLKQIWPFLVLLLAPLLIIGKAVFSPICIGDFDQIHAMAPWHGPEPSQPWDVLQADSVLQFYVWRKLVLESWASGVPPFWNPYVLCGTPLLANSQSGGFYPPHILLGLLRTPVETSIDLLAWFHMLMAGLGLHRLIKALGGNDSGGVVGGLSFQLSPFFIGWLSLSSVPTTVCWIPWIICGLVTAFRSKSCLFATGWQIAIPSSLLLLAGHLQFAAYGLMSAAATLVLLGATLRPFPARTALPCCGFLVLGGIIALPQLVPVLDYSQFSHRRNTPSEEGYRAYVGLALHPYELATRISAPFAQGNPTEFAEPPLPTYTTAIIKPGANFAESAATAGPLVLMLCAFGIARKSTRRVVLFGVGLATLAFLFALGTDLNRILYFTVPGWSATGSPGRIMVLGLMALFASAGLALRSHSANENLKSAALIAGGFTVVITTLLGAVGLSSPEYGFQNGALGTLITANIQTSLAVVIAVGALGAVGLALMAKKQDRIAGPYFAALALAFPFIAGVWSLIRAGDPSFLNSSTLASEFQRIAITNEPWSFVGRPPALMPPNTAAAARIHEVGGYDSLLHRDTTKLLFDISGKDAAPEANGNMMFVKKGASPTALADAGVEILYGGVQAGALDLHPDPQYRASLRAYVEDQGEKREARIVAQNLREIEIEAEGPGTLVLKDRNMPGWSATVDGIVVPITGDMFRSVQLEKSGAVRVKMTYSPLGPVPVVASFFAVVFTVGLALKSRKLNPTT